MDEEQLQKLLTTITSRLDQQGELVKDLIARVETTIQKVEDVLDSNREETKELRASRELLDDVTSEYDRLTEKQSVQLRAMIEWSQQLKNSNIATQE